jgi:hypothetical protein
MIKSYHISQKEVTTISFEIKYALNITKNHIRESLEYTDYTLSDAMEAFEHAFREIHKAQEIDLGNEFMIPEELAYVRSMVTRFLVAEERKYSKITPRPVTEINNIELFCNLGRMSKSDFTYALRSIYRQGNYFPPRYLTSLPNSHQEIYVKIHDSFMKKANHPELVILGN